MERIDLKTPSMEGKIYIGRDAVKTRLPDLTQGQKNFVVYCMHAVLGKCFCNLQ